MENFVNLKIKTEYSSFGVGCKIDDLIKKVKEYKMISLCKTDWDKDGLNGNRYFYEKCKENGIKPIIGISSALELNDEKCFITLYAKSTIGYNRLIEIFDNDNVRPSIEDVLNNHDSLLCVLMQYGSHKNATIIGKLKQAFNDDLYVGLTSGGEYYNAVKKSAKANDIKTVICDKVCFVNKEDFEVHKANKKAFEADNGYKKVIDEKDESDLYFKSYDEILNKYPNDIESIRNTQEIADKCNLTCVEFTDKELTMAFMSFFLEKKVSIDNLKELFNTTEDSTKKIIEMLITRKVIFNYDFTKREMTCVSKEEFDNIVKTTGKNKSELLKKYCVYNSKTSIDGTLKEVEESPLNEELKRVALGIAVDKGRVSTIILQKELKIGYSKAIQLLDWMQEHNYVDDSIPEREVLINKDSFNKLYPNSDKD